jgi:hypothetical protein
MGDCAEIFMLIQRHTAVKMVFITLFIEVTSYDTLSLFYLRKKLRKTEIVLALFYRVVMVLEYFYPALK